MKKSEITKIIQTEIKSLSESKEFWRLDSENIFHLSRISKQIDSLHSNLKSGNDFDPDALDLIINKLQKIKSAAKKFKTGAAAVKAGYIDQAELDKTLNYQKHKNNYNYKQTFGLKPKL